MRDGHDIWINRSGLLNLGTYQDNRHSSEMLSVADDEIQALRAELRRLRNELQKAKSLIDLLRDDIAEHRPDPNAHLGGTE